MNISTLTFDSVDSTNTVAADHARKGASEGLCIIAKSQTAGRGRNGRVWVSQPGSGLYFSILLRPRLQPQFLPLLTLMTGVAVHETLTQCGLEPDIKWVNDVLVREKKISGILAETAETPLGLAVIIGIGINLRNTAFPPEISGTATSIEAEIGREFTPGQVSETLAGEIAKSYALFHSPDGPAAVRDEWRRRSTYFSGKPVRVLTHGTDFEGVTDGLEDNGALRVRMIDGSTRIVESADVERLRARN